MKRPISKRQISSDWDFIKKDTPVQVFSLEFCKIFQNKFCTEHLWTTFSGEALEFTSNGLNAIVKAIYKNGFVFHVF